MAVEFKAGDAITTAVRSIVVTGLKKLVPNLSRVPQAIQIDGKGVRKRTAVRIPAVPTVKPMAGLR